MQTPRATPRFLPTLTEVVKPVLPHREDALLQPAIVATQNASSDEAVVAAVMQRITPVLQAEVERALRQSLQTQLESVLPIVLADVQAAALSAVKRAVNPELESAPL